MANPGWYPDPSGAPRLMYFDGRGWTGRVAPLQTHVGRKLAILVASVVAISVILFLASLINGAA